MEYENDRPNFSQVREDPAVEIEICNIVQPKSILCIASGGCTALTLATTYDNIKIDAVDISQSQLYLCELKGALCVHYSTNIEYILICFQEKGMSCFLIQKLRDLLTRGLITQECYDFWLCHPHYLNDGINQCGKFEHIFRQLVKSNFNFDTVFDNTNLISAFGENAVQYSTRESFSNHFRNVLSKYNRMYGDNTSCNYFYNQIICDKYNKDEVPYYIGKTTIDDINKIQYKNCNFIEYLKKCRDRQYDLIQTSNITDWLTVDDIRELLYELSRVCSSNGAVIMRRLNSDNSLYNIINSVLCQHTQFKLYICAETYIDKSFFYNEVVVLRHIG
jgi:S-adenosylmethionine:diacylglycerol 3-amino-3-carboxypropyl transferase